MTVVFIESARTDLELISGPEKESVMARARRCAVWAYPSTNIPRGHSGSYRYCPVYAGGVSEVKVLVCNISEG